MFFSLKSEGQQSDIITPSIGHNFRIETWAGNGSYENKDGVGEDCAIYWPYEIKFDSTGTGYFTAFGSGSLRKISPTGMVTTITNRTNSGEQFNSVRGLALDKAGNIYLADTGNNRIRKISPTGTAESVVTDKQLPSPYGIVVSDDGIIYVSSGNCIYSIVNGIVEVVAGGNGGYVDGIGSEAQFLLPQGIEIDSEGNLIVADCKNNVIRKIDRKTKAVTTIATGFKYPYGIALDKKGNIFVADYGFNDIKRITPKGQVQSLAINAVYDKGPNTLSLPTGVAVDPAGNLVVCDCYHHVIRKVKCKLEIQALNWPKCEALPEDLDLALLELMSVLKYTPPTNVPKDLIVKLSRTLIHNWPV